MQFMVHVANCPECEREVAVASEPPSDEGLLVRCPHCNEQFAHSKLQVRGVPELILLSPATMPGSDDAGGSPGGHVQAGEPGATTPADQAEGASGQAPSPIDMPVITSTVRQEYDGQISTEPRAARSNGGPSFLRQIVGIIGGGLLGLAIGYFILLWIGGPEKDFLELGRRLPRWAVPGAFHPDDDPPVEEAPEGPSLSDLLEQPLEDEDDPPPEPPEADPADPSDTVSLPDPVMERVLVLDPPELATSDLEAALERAIMAREVLAAGDPGAAPQDERVAAYEALAALAEALTFAEPAAGREDEHEQLRSEAEELLRDALLEEGMAETLGPLAADWLDSPARDHGGIVAAGLVIGSHFGIEQQPGIIVELAGTRRNLVVVGPADIRVPVGSRVVVAGSLVDRPKERIGGYVGSAPRVVWATLVETVTTP